MSEVETPTTRREMLSEAFAEQEKVTEPAAQPTEVTETQETQQQKDDRLRDEKGRFASAEQTPETAKPGTAPPVSPSAPVDRKRPSSWKKEYWEAYDKLDPKTAEYILEREQQFSNGVSTYKQEAERARDLQEALAPFNDDFQRAGVTPAQGVAKLAAAHREIYNAPPEQKPFVFSRLMRDYGVKARMVVQDQQGQWQFLDEARQVQQPQMPDVEKLVENKFAQYQTQSEIQRFAETHEHFEAVRQTMSGLLQSGLAPDLQTAYDAALKLPQHSDIADSLALQQSEEAARKKAEEAAATVARARARTVSTKSATPSGAMGTAQGKWDRRELLSEEWDARVNSGRV